MLGYLSLDIICSSKLTVFLELRSRKTVRFSEQIMSAYKYASIFSHQMKAIVYLIAQKESRNFLFLWFLPFLFCLYHFFFWFSECISLICVISYSFFTFIVSFITGSQPICSLFVSLCLTASLKLYNGCYDAKSYRHMFAWLSFVAPLFYEPR